MMEKEGLEFPPLGSYIFSILLSTVPKVVVLVSHHTVCYDLDIVRYPIASYVATPI